MGENGGEYKERKQVKKREGHTRKVLVLIYKMCRGQSRRVQFRTLSFNP